MSDAPKIYTTGEESITLFDEGMNQIGTGKGAQNRKNGGTFWFDPPPSIREFEVSASFIKVGNREAVPLKRLYFPQGDYANYFFEI